MTPLRVCLFFERWNELPPGVNVGDIVSAIGSAVLKELDHVAGGAPSFELVVHREDYVSTGLATLALVTAPAGVGAVRTTDNLEQTAASSHALVVVASGGVTGASAHAAWKSYTRAMRSGASPRMRAPSTVAVTPELLGLYLSSMRT